MKKCILIIDDEIGICESLEFILENDYDVKFSTDPSEGLIKLKNEYFNLCLLDLKIGQYNGLDILKEIKEIDKNIIVIIMTAYGSINTTVEAMKNGAYSYLTKPLNISELYVLIEQALEFQNLNEKVEYLSRELENKYVYHGMIGRSTAMKKIFVLIDKLKDVDTNVVITGETGTGKELVARAIHYSGKRKRERFVEINCAAIPEGLFEEELFGHKKGTFTSAIEDKMGKFEVANNGTIFLDEIGEISYALQAKLLRVLQEKEYTPIGSTEKRKLNVRVIAATNRDLKMMINNGEFRSDLYYRLNVIEINMPSLRDKKIDLPLLFKHFIQQYNKELDRHVEGLSKEAEKVLLKYSYPGNIRELSNIFEQAILLSSDNIIDINNLPEEVRKNEEIGLCENNKIEFSNEKSLNKEEKNVSTENFVGCSLKEVEIELIKATLIKNDGRKKVTADMLGLSEKGLRNKIVRYKINI